MKLKKIASLALAGVMAVSMLAGCATKAPTTPEEPTTEPTVSLSEEVGKLVGAPDYVIFEDDAELTKKLERGVEAVTAQTITNGYMANGTLTTAGTAFTAGGFVKDDELATLGSQDALVWAENAANGGKTTPDAVYSAVYSISPVVGENELKDQLAKALAAVKNYQYAVNEQAGVNANFTFEYTVSISTCTKSANSSVTGSGQGFNGAADPSLTFVAIQVVRHGTHQ